MFFRLGMTNSLRQLGRSLLVLLGMVLAAMSLTSALSFGQGKMSTSYQFYRDFLGGEILVSPVKWVGQQSQDVRNDRPLVHRQLPATGLSRLELFYPELYRQGYLTNLGVTARQTFSEAEVAELLQHPGVSGVTIHPQIPVDMTNLALPHDHYSAFTLLPLPADGLQDAIDPATYRIQPFDPAGYPGQGLPLVWINFYPTFPEEVIEARIQSIADEQLHYNRDSAVPPSDDQLKRMRRAVVWKQLVEEACLPQPGELAELLLPRMRLDPNGDYVPDYCDPIRLQVEIAGYVTMPTRAISWEHSFGTSTEQSCLHASHIYMTKEAWHETWKQVAGTDSPPLCNVTLQVADMGQLEPIVASLQASFPDYSFIDVASFAERMELTSRLDYFYIAPPYTYSPDRDATLAVPAELGPIIGVLFLLIAGMLIASRMLTGAAARREEIGILKTLGARRRDIALMAMTEAVVIALLGSSGGFLLVRLGGVAIEVSNAVPWPEILQRTVTEGVTVVGLATLVSLLFALLPAIRLSSLTVMGVLRGE
ncbi:MAG: ABC transporter permease [Bacillota bacterium]